MTAGRTAVIVGGGIGGLAAAVALCRRGWRVEVCEQAAQFTEIGAGLSLWPNALRALAVLGLADRVRELGAVEAGGGVRDRAGRWLARTDNVELEQRFGWPLVVVHRADLVRVLVEALPRKTLRPATTITGYMTRAMRWWSNTTTGACAPRWRSVPTACTAPCAALDGPTHGRPDTPGTPPGA